MVILKIAITVLYVVLMIGNLISWYKYVKLRKRIIKSVNYDPKNASYKVLRPILWFAREDKVTHQKLLTFYSTRGINDLVKYGFIEEYVSLQEFIADGISNLK